MAMAADKACSPNGLWQLTYPDFAQLRRSFRFVDIGEIQSPKPRGRIHINAVIRIEGLTGKPGNGFVIHGSPFRGLY